MKAGWPAVLAAAWSISTGALAQAADTPRLTPSDQATIITTLNSNAVFDDRPATAGSERILWEALLNRATAELGLRVRPTEVNPLWAIAPKPRSVEVEARAAQANGTLATWLASLPPKSPRYQALVALRARYRRITDAGGWPTVPKEAAVRAPGEAAVAVLRLRLAAEGYWPASAPDPAAALTSALIEFQAHHDLVADGVVGARTLAALNVPAGERLAQIDANLERWRWLPDMPADRVEVDIGGADATLYAQDRAQLSMRVIVGDRDHQTPMFASRLQAVVFNPPWNVPTSIASKELLPRERAHPGYLASHDFVFVAGGLQQKPGAQNALGRLKIDFPSPFGVYLHDTPSRAAFTLPDRWRSHGCVRLEKPRELAAALMSPQGWTPERIDTAISAGDTNRVTLSANLPLYVLYWTVAIAPDGAASFRRDIYGWDSDLMQALTRSGAGRGVAPQGDSECAAANRP